jgi:hypothetical protein
VLHQQPVVFYLNHLLNHFLFPGDIVTMISVDCERIWLSLSVIHWLWLGPVLAIIAMVLLILEVGVAGDVCLFNNISRYYLTSTQVPRLWEL